MTSKTTTIRSLDDVDRFLRALLVRTQDETDQAILAKCAAVVSVYAMLEDDIRDLTGQVSERLEKVLDRVRSQYGE